MREPFTFEEPWEPPDAPKELLEQLVLELAPTHPLHGQVVEVLATRVDSDDILVQTRDGYALVHLTWCRRASPDPSFPISVSFKSWNDYLEQVYYPEVEQWRRDDPLREWEELPS